MLEEFRAYRIARELHWACQALKISRYLREQLLRASSSVVLNLAEGSGKRTSAEQSRFYGIALGSLREVQAVLDLERIVDPRPIRLASDLGAMLFSLSRTRTSNGNGTQTPNAKRPTAIGPRRTRPKPTDGGETPTAEASGP
jgi:four helix bundle protein